MNQSFEQLLHAARQGSAQALSDLLVPHQAQIVSLAQAKLGKDLLKYMDAGDLAQDVFLAATKSFKNFEGEDEQALLYWLKGICRNCFLAFLRDRAPKMRRTHSLSAASDESTSMNVAALQTSVFGRVEKRHQQAQFERTLAWLPEQDRLLLIKRYLNGAEVPWKSLVDEFGMSEEALRKRGSRLVEVLRSGVKLIQKLDRLKIPEPLQELICMKLLKRLSVADIAAKSGEPIEKIDAILKATEGLLKDA